MKKRGLLCYLCILFVFPELFAQHIALKTNLIADISTTANLAVEFGLGPKSTIDLYANYNPWKYGDHKQFKHFIFQPEYRYWLCEKFNGHFFGAHLHGGIYNVAGIKMPLGMWKHLRDHRYEGWFYGAGISYGYQWILGKHWNLEANVGAGFARLHYDKYECDKCATQLKDNAKKNYFGPTKAALSLIYLF